jgi:hypothetical protein
MELKPAKGLVERNKNMLEQERNRKLERIKEQERVKAQETAGLEEKNREAELGATISRAGGAGGAAGKRNNLL